MIIQDIQTLNKYIPTILVPEGEYTGDAFKKYETYLQSAELFLRREITGNYLFELIAEPNDELVHFCSAIIAHKAYVDAIPFLDLIETPSGFAVTSNSNLTPASAQRVQNLITATNKRLGECIEDLLEYLKENLNFHDDWKSSKTYSLNTDSYIFSVRDFKNYAPLEGGRLEFIKLKPVITRSRILKIESIISKELSLEIIDQLRDNELTEANQAIIEDLRFALANYTIGQDTVANSFIARAKTTILASVDSYPAFKNSYIYHNYLKATTSDTDAPFKAFGI